MKHPYKGRYIITQVYMNKSNSYASGYHLGIDLVGLDDKRIFAIEDGVVDNISTNDAYGNSVVVKMNDGLYSRYSHLEKIQVKAGQIVREGQTQIGIEGMTGYVKGSDPRHLDLRITRLPYHSNNIYDYFNSAEYIGIPNIKNKIIIPKDGCKVENLVLYGGHDDGAAKLLAHHLQCPIMHLDHYKMKPIDAKNIFMVGGAYKPTPNTILLSGQNRYATMQAVLDYIN